MNFDKELIHRILKKILDGLVLTVIAGVCTVWLAEKLKGEAYPAMVESLLCEPLDNVYESENIFIERNETSIPVGDSIRCTVSAPNADYVSWRSTNQSHAVRSGPMLDPEKIIDPCPQSSNESISFCQDFNFQEQGTYAISVKVAKAGGNSFDFDESEIFVFIQEEDTVEINVAASVPPSPQVREIKIPINHTQAAGGGLTTKTENYSKIIYEAPVGQKIESARFIGQSVNNTSIKGTRITGNKLLFEYTMRSGMMLDRYRAWIKGNVLVNVLILDETPLSVFESKLNAVIDKELILGDKKLPDDTEFTFTIDKNSVSTKFDAPVQLSDYQITVTNDAGRAKFLVSR